jgi:hypothetical protein
MQKSGQPVVGRLREVAWDLSARATFDLENGFVACWDLKEVTIMHPGPGTQVLPLLGPFPFPCHAALH